MSDSEENNRLTAQIPVMSAFSIMFVSIGFSCFVWQALTAAWMYYQSKKPIVALVAFQAIFGVIVTFVTLLASLIDVDCTFLLLFSVVGVNTGDIALQFVLLWKAYLGNNRSKWLLLFGCLPIIAIIVFICINMTFGRSTSKTTIGVCSTTYPTFIVVTKSIIDCTSNTFLSFCFISVIYRHYRVFGSSVQKTLIKEGLIYCFGVCFSNIMTGVLLFKKVLGGSSPILYTIDWYLASYLIIKQLSYKNTALESPEKDDESLCESEPEHVHIPSPPFNSKHKSMDGTICDSPTSIRYDRTSKYNQPVYL